MGLISGRVPSVTLLIIVLSYVTNIVINIYLHLLLTSRSAVPSRFNEPTNGVATTPAPCLGEGRGSGIYIRPLVVAATHRNQCENYEIAKRDSGVGGIRILTCRLSHHSDTVS